MRRTSASDALTPVHRGRLNSKQQDDNLSPGAAGVKRGFQSLELSLEQTFDGQQEPSGKRLCSAPLPKRMEWGGDGTAGPSAVRKSKDKEN